MGAAISFKRPDGGDANGYLANAGRGDAPSVVVIQGWWGLSEQIKAITGLKRTPTRWSLVSKTRSFW
jgi:carboxymethylenebutenolidase